MSIAVRDLQALARERVQSGGPPDWITECAYDPSFKAKSGGPVTQLLVQQQFHTELRQTYVRVALRLETMQAVQHQSQWRLEFEPQSQSLLLHSIKIIRGTVSREHVSLDKVQFLQREAGLENFFRLAGGVTLLLVLEDVCPGDILEWSYTLTDRPKLLPNHAGGFFSLPPGLEIGRHHLSVTYSEKRLLKWISSSPTLAPATTVVDGMVTSVWAGEKFSSPEPEPSTPGWRLDFPWIQVSDCPDWQTVAHAVLEAWEKDIPGDGFEALLAEVKAADPNLLDRVDRAITLIQDEFRYLSVNLESGGYLPARAEEVVRRRYGDCKDLAFLLVRMLRGLGIPARPVLVHGTWRQAVSALLPWPGAFNHVIVEYEVEKEKRWVDPTTKMQGGGALGRTSTDFRLGLPIDAATTGLVPIPKASLPGGSSEIKETFLLDTTGNPSSLAILVTASGVYADNLRAEFANGLESAAKARLQNCANRFTRAARVGQLQYRDDRRRNVFVAAELFEISGFLKPGASPDTVTFVVQSGVASGLVCPSAAARRSPFALPFPCNQVHIVEVEFSGMNAITLAPFSSGNDYFSFSRRSRSLHHYFKTTFAFNTLSDAVSPDRLPEHRKLVEPVWQATLVTLRLPAGYRAMKRRSDFGVLPDAPAAASIGHPPGRTESEDSRVPAQPAEGGQSHGMTTATASGLGTPIAPRIVTATLASPADTAHRHQRRRNDPFVELPYYGRRRLNLKCVASLCLFLLSVFAAAVAVVLGRVQGGESFAGALYLLAFPVFVMAIVLAVRGLRQCAREPEFDSNSRLLATLVLAFGSVFGLFLVAGLIVGVQPSTREANHRSGYSNFDTELLRFPAAHCAFRPPGPPWRQMDARAFGRGPMLAFERPGPMFFSLSAHPIDPVHSDPRGWLVEWSKAQKQHSTTSYRLITEGESKRHGISGWRIETEGNFQGHDYHIVDWLFVNNGLGYQLSLWGPTDLAPQVRDESERLFEEFQLGAPEPTPLGLPGR